MNHCTSRSIGPLATAAAAAAMLAGCVASPPSSGNAPATSVTLAPAAAAALQDCEGLSTRFTFAATRLDSAVRVAAGAPVPNSAPVGAHCLVKGQMNARKGRDGQDYAIGFEMRLPQNWNQRFLHQVNGGNDGVVVPAERYEVTGEVGEGLRVPVTAGAAELVVGHAHPLGACRGVAPTVGSRCAMVSP